MAGMYFSPFFFLVTFFLLLLSSQEYTLYVKHATYLQEANVFFILATNPIETCLDKFNRFSTGSRDYTITQRILVQYLPYVKLYVRRDGNGENQTVFECE